MRQYAGPCQTPASPSAPQRPCLSLLLKMRQLRTKELLSLPPPSPTFSARVEASTRSLGQATAGVEGPHLWKHVRTPVGWFSEAGGAIAIADKDQSHRELGLRRTMVTAEAGRWELLQTCSWGCSRSPEAKFHCLLTPPTHRSWSPAGKDRVPRQLRTTLAVCITPFLRQR